MPPALAGLFIKGKEELVPLKHDCFAGGVPCGTRLRIHIALGDFHAPVGCSGVFGVFGWEGFCPAGIGGLCGHGNQHLKRNEY